MRDTDRTDDPSRHEMVMTTSTEHEAAFECPVAGCGRRVVLDRATLALRVQHPGRPGVLHRGSTASTALRSAVA
ncbi:MAG: hypothetical protein AB7W59_32795 [Acidimicrobiia bacterium]